MTANRISSHAEKRCRQRRIDRRQARSVLRQVEHILTERPLRFTIGGKTYVAARGRNRSILITAWQKEAPDGK